MKTRHIRLAIACLDGLLFSHLKDFDCRPLFDIVYESMLP